MQLGALKGYLVLASDIDVAVFNLTTMSRVNPVPRLSSASVSAGPNNPRTNNPSERRQGCAKRGIEKAVSKRKRRIEQKR